MILPTVKVTILSRGAIVLNVRALTSHDRATIYQRCIQLENHRLVKKVIPEYEQNRIRLTFPAGMEQPEFDARARSIVKQLAGREFKMPIQVDRLHR